MKRTFMTSKCTNSITLSQRKKQKKKSHHLFGTRSLKSIVSLIHLINHIDSNKRYQALKPKHV